MARTIGRSSKDLTRYVNYFAGWRDGRRGLPVLAPSQPLPTHLARINSEYLEAMDAIWLDLLQETSALRQERERLVLELERARERRDIARTALDSHLATQPGMERKFGERTMPEELVRDRRRRAWIATRRRLEESWTTKRNYVVTVNQDLRGLDERLLIELQSAQTWARALHGQAGVGRAAYLRGACRTHFDGPTLTGMLDTFALHEPDWVGFPHLEDFLHAQKRARHGGIAA